MSDLFGGLKNLGALGGLVKGLSGLMPTDDPAVQLINAQSEISELEAKELELYAEVGKMAAAKHGLESFGEISELIKLTSVNLSAAKERLQSLKVEVHAKEQAEHKALEVRTCPECGHVNPDGTKFCQECGAKVGISKNTCASCGAENESGIKFCQECGTRLKAVSESPVCACCGATNPLGTKFCSECGERLE